MAEHNFNPIKLAWPNTIYMTLAAPAIGNRIFDTYADAEEFVSDPTCVVGVILRVIKDTPEKNGAYIVMPKNDTIAKKHLESVCKGGSEISWEVIE